ncbi:hypothetical protein GCM10020366_24410 [Saccharopolyspora gregorii]|uniref:Uncharacterized protein n=1 Tax=Saccharopolyspora gregorii TaxID=33914 RepID=A0ABP6RSC1_9PSEU
MNNQIAAASSSGDTSTNPKLSTMYQRNGRASGQNRRNTSRTPIDGAVSTKPASSATGGSNNHRIGPRTTYPLLPTGVTPAPGKVRASPGR